MTTTSLSVGQIKTRLLAFGSLVGAGAVVTGAAAAAAAGGDPGIGLSVGGSLVSALAGVGGNLFATDLYEVLAKRLGHSDEVLHNHDLTKAVGDAIGIVIQKAAEDPRHTADKKSLTRIARTNPDHWQLLVALGGETLAGISETQLPAFFSTRAEDITTLTALDPPTWHQLLRWLAKQEDVYVSDETYDRVAQQLHTTFPKALREVLKHDFATNGKAYAGLELMLKGEIIAASQESLAAIRELKADSRTQHAEVVERLEQLISIVWSLWVKSLDDPSKGREVYGATEHPLSISFKIRPLDGFGTQEVEGKTYLETGAKFRIALGNESNRSLIVESVGIHIDDHQPLPHTEAARPKLELMKFGAARIPHQLFLNVSASTWYGWWLISREEGSIERRNISAGATNLLESLDAQPLVFEIEPDRPEVIVGSIITTERGLFELSFNFEYLTNDGVSKIRRTESLRILNASGK